MLLIAGCPLCAISRIGKSIEKESGCTGGGGERGETASPGEGVTLEG